MVFFLDDLNLPYVETYGTQNAVALLTQHLQYGNCFDRTDLVRACVNVCVCFCVRECVCVRLSVCLSVLSW